MTPQPTGHNKMMVADSFSRLGWVQVDLILVVIGSRPQPIHDPHGTKVHFSFAHAMKKTAKTKE